MNELPRYWVFAKKAIGRPEVPGKFMEWLTLIHSGLIAGILAIVAWLAWDAHRGYVLACCGIMLLTVILTYLEVRGLRAKRAKAEAELQAWQSILD